MVQRDQCGTLAGAEKIIFFNWRIGRAKATWRPRRWNPVNPCPKGLPGVAWGRNYTRAIAYTAYAAASKHFWYSLSRHVPTNDLAMVCFQASRRAPSASTAYAVQATTHYQTHPERQSRSRSAPKKVINLDPMAPVPSLSITRGPPVVAMRYSGPHTTPAIVDYKYMTSTL